MFEKEESFGEKINTINTDHDNYTQSGFMKELADEIASEESFLKKETENVLNLQENSEHKCSLKSVFKYPRILNGSSECFSVRFDKIENTLAAGRKILFKKRIFKRKYNFI